MRKKNGCAGHGLSEGFTPKTLTMVKVLQVHSEDYPSVSAFVWRSLQSPERRTVPLPMLSPPPPSWRRATGLLPLLAALACTAASAQQPPGAERQRELIRMVRQDCGSCHGLQLTGGLGPALTREALADKPLESMASTIYGGRPGTPMAPWKAMLSEADALWIAQQLMAGFPEPQKDAR